jgi:hypothetical protein
MILKAIFYSYTAWYAISELIWIFQTKSKCEENHELRVTFDEYSKRKKEEKARLKADPTAIKKEESAQDKEDKSKAIWAFVTKFPLILWLIFGVFTFNWVPFLFMWLTQLVMGLITLPVKKYALPIGSDFKGKAYIAIAWINSVWGFAFCIFIIINAYHLHIDFSPLVANHFK